MASSALNRAAGVRPGEYTAVLNSSTHTVFVEEGKLTKCGCGSIQVTGDAGGYYYVLDSAGKQLASANLGKATSLFPGAYTVKVHNTTATADVKSGGPTTLQTGTLDVTGSTDEYYYVLDSAGTQLASSTFQKKTALLPGSWIAKVNETRVPVEIKPGETTTTQTGALMVRGTTNEYYYVHDDAGSQLASGRLGKSTALFPGSYKVKVNNSIAPATITAGQVTEVATGTVNAKKAGTEYYYVLDNNGSQLASAQVNRPSALLPGEYTIRIGDTKKQAAVSAGKDTALTW